ncbi:transposable element Tcb2 transposase [Trichonephila inaurata madagascariensis]|uniref:Transposable element Tcb2 transposase n=1 Tax=Trichonephila inaurata madagascariensis TaxID=2747483 RepID=A0A8X7BS48_9ARAC|nr:transposable element Tcb2 transposase [Trichonephila inaurata madagascariensis]
MIVVKKTSMEFRHDIHRLYEEEHVSERKIAQKLGISPSTVHYWITRRAESATTKAEWHRIVFSDEKIFRSSSRGALRVYRSVQGSDRFDDQYLVHSSNSIHTAPRFTMCVWLALEGMVKFLNASKERRTLNAEYYTRLSHP